MFCKGSYVGSKMYIECSVLRQVFIWLLVLNMENSILRVIFFVSFYFPFLQCVQKKVMLILLELYQNQQ